MIAPSRRNHLIAYTYLLPSAKNAEYCPLQSLIGFRCAEAQYPDPGVTWVNADDKLLAMDTIPLHIGRSRSFEAVGTMQKSSIEAFVEGNWYYTATMIPEEGRRLLGELTPEEKPAAAHDKIAQSLINTQQWVSWTSR